VMQVMLATYLNDRYVFCMRCQVRILILLPVNIILHQVRRSIQRTEGTQWMKTGYLLNVMRDSIFLTPSITEYGV
jgi:hypothetical protein